MTEVSPSLASSEQPPKTPMSHLLEVLENINSIPENRRDMPAKLAKRGIFRPERVAYPGMPDGQLAQIKTYDEEARLEAQAEVTKLFETIKALSEAEQQQLARDYVARVIGGGSVSSTRDYEAMVALYRKMPKDTPFYKEFFAQADAIHRKDGARDGFNPDKSW